MMPAWHQLKHDHGVGKIGAARRYYQNNNFEKCIKKQTFFFINGEKGLLLKNLLNIHQKIEIDVFTREQI